MCRPEFPNAFTCGPGVWRSLPLSRGLLLWLRAGIRYVDRCAYLSLDVYMYMCIVLVCVALAVCWYYVLYMVYRQICGSVYTCICVLFCCVALAACWYYVLYTVCRQICILYTVSDMLVCLYIYMCKVLLCLRASIRYVDRCACLSTDLYICMCVVLFCSLAACKCIACGPKTRFCL